MAGELQRSSFQLPILFYWNLMNLRLKVDKSTEQGPHFSANGGDLENGNHKDKACTVKIRQNHCSPDEQIIK